LKNTTNGPLARKADLTIEDLPPEIIVYDHKRNRIHCLNPSTSFIWQRCDGRTTIEDIAAGLPEIGLPADLDIVRRALKDLARTHLLADDQAFANSSLPSRRMLVRRLGLAAGSAATLLPAIRSIVAPTPAMAKSGDSHTPDPPVKIHPRHPNHPPHP
jgi:hypothetical protein